MKKIVMQGPGRSALVDVPDLTPGPEEVLVKLRYCGVCMSEHHYWQTAGQGMTFGHEPMGTVAALGENVRGFQIGDRVTGLAQEAFAEYVLFHQSLVIPVPDNVADEDAVAEPLSCLVSAATKIPVVMPGDPVAVVGVGYMGLGFLSLLKMKGAGPIIAVDLRKEALDNALAFGATEVYYPKDVPAKYLCRFDDIWSTDNGIRVVTEWAGTNEALNLAAEMTHVDGLLGIGSYHTGGPRSCDIQLWNAKALDVVSTHERKDPFQIECCRRSMEMLSTGQWNYQRLKTKVYALSEFDEAQRALDTKPDGMIKALVDCTKY